MIDMGGPLETTAVIVLAAIAMFFAWNAIRERGAGSKTDVAAEATKRTTGGLSAMLLGVATVFAVVTSEVSALLGQLGELVAMFSAEAVNLAIVVVGALGLGGVIDISPLEFVVVALVIAGLVAVIRR